MSQDSWTIRKDEMMISWVFKMRNNHYGVKTKTIKYRKWGMKQNLAGWKFSTQKSNGIIYSDFEDKFRALFKVYCIHTIYRFEAREVRSPTVQTVCKSELKWRSYGHLKTTAPSWRVISKWFRNSTYEFEIHFEMTPISNSPTATLMFRLLYPRIASIQLMNSKSTSK